MFHLFAYNNFHKVLKINDLWLKWTLKRGAHVLGALFFVLFLFGCRESGEPVQKSEPIQMKPMEYSRFFRIGEISDNKVVELLSVVGGDTLVRRYTLSFDSEVSGNAALKVPLRRVVALSSSHLGYMLRLGLSDRVVAVGEGRYIVDEGLYKRFKERALVELGYGNAMNVEKLMATKPDVIFTFATGSGHDDYARLESLGLNVMLTSEWQDESPLAKAEWIKLYATLFDSGDGRLVARADSIFRSEVAEYNRVRDYVGQHFSSSDTSCIGPRVLAGMSYGGVWFAQGAESYTARLIKDAGGCYLFRDVPGREIRLTLEDVLKEADKVDVWLNPGMLSSVREILETEPRVASIRAFRDGRVYQNDGYLGPGGGSDFYESAVVRPSDLLKNMVECLQSRYIPFDSTGNFLRTETRWYHNIISL